MGTGFDGSKLGFGLRVRIEGVCVHGRCGSRHTRLHRSGGHRRRKLRLRRNFKLRRGLRRGRRNRRRNLIAHAGADHNLIIGGDNPDMLETCRICHGDPFACLPCPRIRVYCD